MTRSVDTKAYRHFIAALVEARLLADVTQATLAKRLNRPQSYVSKYEQKERRLDVVEFLYIARALGIAPMNVISSVLPFVNDGE